MWAISIKICQHLELGVDEPGKAHACAPPRARAPGVLRHNVMPARFRQVVHTRVARLEVAGGVGFEDKDLNPRVDVHVRKERNKFLAA